MPEGFGREEDLDFFEDGSTPKETPTTPSVNNLFDVPEKNSQTAPQKSASKGLINFLSAHCNFFKKSSSTLPLISSNKKKSSAYACLSQFFCCFRLRRAKEDQVDSQAQHHTTYYIQ